MNTFLYVGHIYAYYLRRVLYIALDICNITYNNIINCSKENENRMEQVMKKR